MGMGWTRRRLLVSTGALAGACAAPSRPGDALAQLYADPARNVWPSEMKELSPEIQELYRYAAANREVLRYMPCFCGCVNAGHASNFDCYIREVLPDGRVRIDTMSFG